MTAETIIPASTLSKDQELLISEIQAKAVQSVALEIGLECSPRMLEEPEECPTCRTPVLMLVEPFDLCFDCFGEISLGSN